MPMLIGILAGTAPTAPDWTSYAQTGGTIGVLTLLILGLMRQWLVPGWTYKAMEKDRDYYRQIANQSLLLADRQTTVAEVLTDRLAQQARREQQRIDQAREDRLQARRDVLSHEYPDEDEGGT